MLHAHRPRSITLARLIGAVVFLGMTHYTRAEAVDISSIHLVIIDSSKMMPGQSLIFGPPRIVDVAISNQEAPAKTKTTSKAKIKKLPETTASVDTQEAAVTDDSLAPHAVTDARAEPLVPSGPSEAEIYAELDKLADIQPLTVETPAETKLIASVEDSAEHELALLDEDKASTDPTAEKKSSLTQIPLAPVKVAGAVKQKTMAELMVLKYLQSKKTAAADSQVDESRTPASADTN